MFKGPSLAFITNSFIRFFCLIASHVLCLTNIISLCWCDLLILNFYACIVIIDIKHFDVWRLTQFAFVLLKFICTAFCPICCIKIVRFSIRLRRRGATTGHICIIFLFFYNNRNLTACPTLIRLEMCTSIETNIFFDFCGVLVFWFQLERGCIVVERVGRIGIQKKLRKECVKDVYQVKHGRPSLIDNIQAYTARAIWMIKETERVRKTELINKIVSGWLIYQRRKSTWSILTPHLC